MDQTASDVLQAACDQVQTVQALEFQWMDDSGSEAKVWSDARRLLRMKVREATADESTFKDYEFADVTTSDMQ